MSCIIIAVHQRPKNDECSSDVLFLMSHLVFDYEGDDIIAYLTSRSLFDIKRMWMFYPMIDGNGTNL